MQAADAEEAAPILSGAEDVASSSKVVQEKPHDPPAKSADEWGAFYSMPPRWTKDDAKDEPRTASGDSPFKSALSDENIGHKLASLLRYHLDDSNGITTDEQGWVSIVSIVEHSSDVGLHGCSADDLVRVVENNSHGTRGKRFELSDSKDRVKATYRHPPKERRSGFSDSRGRSDRHRGNSGWHGSGWHDSYKGSDGWWDGNGDSKWNDSWQEGAKGDGSWAQWKAEKPGFSPSPDDAIAKDAAVASSWGEASGKTTQADSDDTPVTDSASSLSPALAPAAAPCEWEQWFTPDNMEPYFYNTKTEETFFPGDVADAEEQGWTRYVDTDGERPDKIYWWHEPSSRSFYEEDAIGEAEA